MAKKDEKVIPNKVAPEVLRALADVVGEEWVTDDRAVIETYSRFSVDAAGTLRKHQKDPQQYRHVLCFPQQPRKSRQLCALPTALRCR